MALRSWPVAGVASVGKQLAFRILGSLEVLAAGEPLVVGAPKERALLALLLVHRNEPVATERLMEELWAGRAPQRAADALHVYVSHLRKVLEPGRGRNEAAAVLQSSPSGYLLAVEEGSCDVDRFLRLYQDGAAEVASAPERAGAGLREALALWRGPALADFVYEGWAQAEIARLEELRLACIEDRIDADLGCGRHAELVGELEALVGEQPLRERPWGQLMVALYRCGRQAEALEAYQQARGALVEELGIEPSPSLQTLNRRILNHDAALAAPERIESTQGPVKLPTAATPFLGRKRELAEVVALLAGPEVRLLTLTGPGGTGKTRLALQAANEVAERFLDGVYWVPLAPLRDPGLLLATIANALNVREEPGKPLADTLAAELGGKRTLIVVDNVEHLMPDAARQLGSLGGVLGPQLLITSRERLQLQGEVVYSVPTLDDTDAIELFLARSRALEYGIETNGDVRELCSRLDNLPLALELAAARTQLFSPRQLLERLEQRLDLFKGPRDVDPRQRTLRATIEWSYDLLAEAEQRLFRWLSVFAGGCTYEAAEHVGGADPDTLQSLLDKSLLRRRGNELAARYWMLETVREFAADRLSEAGESDAGRERRRRYFIDQALEAREGLLGPLESEWFRRLDADRENLLLSLSELDAGGDVDGVLRFASYSGYFRVRGFERRLFDATQRALPNPGGDPADRARALRAATTAARNLGLLEVASELSRKLVDHSRWLGDAENRMSALNGASGIAVERGQMDEAASYLEEYQELASASASPLHISGALAAKANLALNTGDWDAAVAACRDGLALRSQTPATLVGMHLVNLAYSLAMKDDPREVLDVAEESLELHARLGDGSRIAYTLEPIARVVSRQWPEQAAKLIAVAEELARARGVFVFEPFEQAFHEQTCDAIRERVPEPSEDARSSEVNLEVAVELASRAIEEARALERAPTIAAREA